MAPPQNELDRLLNVYLKPLSFRKRNRNWFRRGDEISTLLNLQKSIYGNQFYLNVGYWFTALGARELPPAHQLDAHARLETLVPQAQQPEVEDLLDLENKRPPEERETRLLSILDTVVRPLLDAEDSVDGIRRAIAGSRPGHWAMRGPAQTLLAESGR